LQCRQPLFSAAAQRGGIRGLVVVLLHEWACEE
jgi:hypothetical protein